MQESGAKDRSPPLLLQSHRGRPVKAQSDLHPKPEHFPVPPTTQKVSMRRMCCAIPAQDRKRKQRSCWMPQCAGRHQEGTLTEWDIVYFSAMKLQAGKPKAVARCDWCNQGLLGQTRRRAPAFPLVNHGTGLWNDRLDLCMPHIIIKFGVQGT